MKALDEEKWLQTATAKNHLDYGFPVGGIGADGFRMHISKKAEYVPEVHTSEKFFNALEKIESDKPRFIFLISRKYLVEALSGMDEDRIAFYSSGPDKAVLIQEAEDEDSPGRLAIIMPLLPPQGSNVFVPLRPKKEVIIPMEGGYG